MQVVGYMAQVPGGRLGWHDYAVRRRANGATFGHAQLLLNGMGLARRHGHESLPAGMAPCIGRRRKNKNAPQPD